MKTLLICTLIGILVALAIAGRSMIQGGGSHDDPSATPAQQRSRRMVRALTWRIGLSVALFLFVLLSYKMGWISPTGIAAGQ